MDTKRLITRRRALIAGAAGVGGLMIPRYWKDLPPTYGNILRMGDTLTYAAHRTLLPRQSLVREYGRHGSGQTYLRELLLVADHTAYHVGQLVLMRRLLNAWG